MALTGAETGTNEQKTQEGATPKKESPRLLIGPAGSAMFFVDTWVEEIVFKEGQKTSIQQKKQWPVRLTKARIAGLPHIAGGCSVEITPEDARRKGLTFVDFCNLIRKHSGYGIQFVFLDDKSKDRNDNPVTDRILNQIRARADHEADVQREAIEEAALGSDMNRDESWDEAHKRLGLPVMQIRREEE